MEAVECLDKECSALGGLFQQVVNDMKVRLSRQLKLIFIFFSRENDRFKKGGMND